MKYHLSALALVILLSGCATQVKSLGGPEELRKAELQEEIFKQYLVQKELIKKLEVKINLLETELAKYQK